ncbi:MAG: hypothetical protein A2Y94_09390 [Caldithrix sp. RBG_13_44_9]|nr:MAG: hypothetical protein A2Y94_09390 [Caldithrix sp. RBG_13_44_9]
MRLIVLIIWISICPLLVNAGTTVKNVILYIGDGMGITQITSSRIYLMGADGRFEMEKMPITGLITTHSVDRLITDSAAGATALASGYKTKNGMIGMNRDSVAVVTILEAARDKGLSIGLISTSSITHATPASFAAHVSSRRSQSEVASQLIDAQISLLLGGGKSFFLPQELSGSKRSDQIDLRQLAVEKGYSIVQNKEELQKIGKGPVLGIFALEGLQGDSSEPSLKDMTEAALKVLSQNKKGFFLMVEGSQIDWAGHDNSFPDLWREMKAFDDAVAVGLQYSAENEKTLVIVTADHETGGLLIEDGHNDGKDLQIAWHLKGHTGTMVPLFVSGPKAELFSGIKDNTEIPVILSELLGIRNFPRFQSSHPVK